MNTIRGKINQRAEMFQNSTCITFGIDMYIMQDFSINTTSICYIIHIAQYLLLTIWFANCKMNNQLCINIQDKIRIGSICIVYKFKDLCVTFDCRWFANCICKLFDLSLYNVLSNFICLYISYIYLKSYNFSPIIHIIHTKCYN